MDFLETRLNVREFEVFRAWYRRREKHLAYRLNLHEATDHCLVFGIHGVHPAISLVVRTSGFDVSVDWEGVNWDMLISFDFEVLQTDTGYLCGFCIDEFASARFISLEALWEQHCFESIAGWLKEQLKPATWLYLDGQPDHFTSAILSAATRKDYSDTAAYSLLVHLDQKPLSGH